MLKNFLSHAERQVEMICYGSSLRRTLLPTGAAGYASSERLAKVRPL